MTNGGRCRLAILASHPIQYFTPVYRLLAAQADLDVRVFFCSDFGVANRYDKQFDRVLRWDWDQLSGYDHVFLKNISPVRDTFNPMHAINPGAFGRLLGSYDAVWMNGYMYPSNWLALAAVSIRRARLLLRSELRLDRGRVARRSDPVRDWVVRKWITWSDALLYIGSANRDAYLHYGADERKLHFAPYSVDVHRYADPKLQDASLKLDLRRQLGIPGDAIVMLYAGKLVPRKHPERLLDVAEWTASRRGHVVMVGSGPLEVSLRAEATRRRITNITWLGFVNQSQLPRTYAVADVFVMPSELEPWGLVLNEAMAAGLAPIASRDVGATLDLIDHGRNGFCLDVCDGDSLREAVLTLTSNAVLRRSFGDAARARSLEFSYEATAGGIVHALVSLGLMPPASLDANHHALAATNA